MTDRGVSYEGTPPPRGPSGNSERRVALVIGNGAYSHAAPLENPVRDAEAMAARLTKLGFDVVKGLDLDLRKLGDVQSAFEDKLRLRPDVALLFYAGHGLQVEGRNYLVPIDAEITAKSHLATRALHFNDLLDDMAQGAGASLIFLDACRDNPFTRNLARSLGDTARYAGVRGGLARIEKVAGTFIAYATAPDQVAFDGKGQNSPFTSALLDHIETPGLSVGDLMIDVRNKVLAETGNKQEPWDQSSLRARFYFVPPEVTPPPMPQSVSEAASEWGVIQGTTSLAVLAKFQERHPDPPWFDYAEARANELRAADAARVAVEDAERQQVETVAAWRHQKPEREAQPPSPWPIPPSVIAEDTTYGSVDMALADGESAQPCIAAQHREREPSVSPSAAVLVFMLAGGTTCALGVGGLMAATFSQYMWVLFKNTGFFLADHGTGLFPGVLVAILCLAWLGLLNWYFDRKRLGMNWRVARNYFLWLALITISNGFFGDFTRAKIIPSSYLEIILSAFLFMAAIDFGRNCFDPRFQGQNAAAFVSFAFASIAVILSLAVWMK